MTKLFKGFFRPLCGFGLILGVLFFAASLTPSLIPRNHVVQGVLSGMAFGAGYAMGVLLRGLWRYLELPGLSAAVMRLVTPLAGLGCVALVVTALYHTKAWQNSVRSVMGMDPVESGYPFTVSVIALLVSCVLILLARGLIGFGKTLARKFYSRFPRRISIVAGVVVAGFLTVTLTNGVLVEYTFRFLDRSF